MKARKQGTTYAMTGTLYKTTTVAGVKTTTAINLTGSSLTLSMRDRKTKAAKISNAGVTIVTPAAGTWSYAVLAADLDTPNGYEIMLTETRGDGTKWKYPSHGYEPLDVEEAF